MLTATARVGTHRFEITGFGENIVTAYADLLHSAPEVALTASFRQLVDV